MKPMVQAEAHPVASCASPPATGRSAKAFDLVVADASWTWTERLFAPLADLGLRVLLIKACDWRNALHQKRPARDWFCPRRQVSETLWEQTIVLPPGWMKSYPRVGMRPIAWAVRSWHRALANRNPIALAISYPHYLYLRDLVRPGALVYYNMDDYGFYWTSRRLAVQRLERRAVREADLSIFCAKVRSEELRSAVPEASERIIHLPHGAPASSIAPEPQDRPAAPPADMANLPRPLLGFVGSLEDRLDWPLIGHLAREFPGGSIVLIGREPAPQAGAAWYAEYQSVVALPNVHRLGWRPQSELGQYNAAFDVCLIPYRTDHPFNRAACPTKVMDYMATSRPVVTTPLPECRLYGHLFEIADSAESFASAVRSVVECGSDDGRASLRWEAARAATWERTSAAVLEHLRSLAESRA